MSSVAVKKEVNTPNIPDEEQEDRKVEVMKVSKEEKTKETSESRDPKLTAVEQKRSKLLFNNLLGHLKKAKTGLEKEKPHLDQQSQLQKRIQKDLDVNNQDLMEKKVSYVLPY